MKTHKVASKDAAKALCNEMEKDFPKSQSAYRPSGKIDEQTFKNISIGVIISILVSVTIVFFIYNFSTKAAIHLYSHLDHESSGRIPKHDYDPYIISIVCTFLSSAAPIIFLPLLSGYICLIFLKKSKTRNIVLTVIAGFLSGFLSSICFVFLSQLITGSYYFTDHGKNIIQNAVKYRSLVLLPLNLYSRAFGSGWILFSSLMTLWNTIISIEICHSYILKKKFCENCSEYLIKHRYWNLSRKETMDIIPLIKDKRINKISTYFVNRESPKWEDSEFMANLFLCPKCRKGYFEVEAIRHATSSSGDVKKEWLISSSSLPENEVMLFSQTEFHKVTHVDYSNNRLEFYLADGRVLLGLKQHQLSKTSRRDVRYVYFKDEWMFIVNTEENGSLEKFKVYQK